LHQVDDRDPFIFKTTDYGKTWKPISSGIPKSPFSYVHVVREDPFRKGMLYAGTENGLYLSFDDGAHWRPLQSKLPHAPVSWLTVEPRFHDLVVATYGRGFFILDDVTPLEEWSEAVHDSSERLFPPVPAYRFRAVSQPAYAPTGTAEGKNGPDGAVLTYWLKKSVPKPKKTSDDEEEAKEKPPLVQLRVFDSTGARVRSLRGTNEAGMNRVVWDLRYDPIPDVRLRATPKGNPHLWEEKRYVGKDRRPVLYYGIEDATRGPLVPPGTYTVKLRVGDREATAAVEVRRDPGSAGTSDDVEAESKLSLAIYKDSVAAAEMLGELEWTRVQLEQLKKRLAAAKAQESLVTPVSGLRQKAEEVEALLLQPTIAEGDQKSFRGPLGLFLKLVWLNAEVSTGAADVSGNPDLAPTHPEREVFELLDRQLDDARRRFRSLYDESVSEFNRAMAAKGMAGIVSVKEVLPEFPPEKEKKPDDEED
jgi:hypothetical protein